MCVAGGPREAIGRLGHAAELGAGRKLLEKSGVDEIFQLVLQGKKEGRGKRKGWRREIGRLMKMRRMMK
jgi:hypothetical protein